MKRYLFLLFCFTATVFLSSAYAQNLLRNADFEEARAKDLVKVSENFGELAGDWFMVIKSASTGTADITEAEAISGANAFHTHLEAIGARYNYFLAQELQNVEPGTYTYSIWLKASQAGVSFRLGADSDLNNSGDLLANKTFTTTTGWVKYDLPVSVAEAAPVLRLVVRFNCGSTGVVDNTHVPIDYYVDDTFFGSSPMLANGDFESSVAGESLVVTSDKGGDLLAKWRLVVKPASLGSATVTQDVPDVFGGLNSLRISVENIDYRYRLFLAQEIENVAPKKYTLSFQMKADKAGIPVRVDFMNIEKDATNGGTDFSKTSITTATEWAQYEIPLDLSAETEVKALMRIAFRLNCLSGGGVQNEPVTYWLDNIVLKENEATSNLPSLNTQVDVPFYTDGNSLRFSGLKETAEVTVFNTTGAVVVSGLVAPGQSLQIPYAGYYIVRARTSEGVIAAKAVIK